MVRSIYLHISDFVIKVYFKKPPSLLFLRDKLQKEIMMFFKDFVSVHKPKKIDYTIELKGDNTIKFITDKNAKVNFIGLYEKKGGNKMTTYYTISTSQFHFIIKQVISDLLMNSGFFQHASGIVHNNKVYLFLGKSGAGKSTISSLLSPSYQRFCDDLIIIKKGGNNYYCYQSPLWETNWWAKKVNEHYMLGGIFFLKKATHCRIQRIKEKNKALDLLLSDLTYERETIVQKMGIFFEFINKFPDYYYLYFPNNKKKVEELFNNFFTSDQR